MLFLRTAGRQKSRYKQGTWDPALTSGLAVLVAIVFFTGTGSCLTMPESPTVRVNDYAGVLSQSVRSSIERDLTGLEDTTSTQVVVAIFPSLEEESLEDWVNRLFEKWRLGNQKLDNGVLLAIFMKEQRARIEVGYGLEGVLTDALSSRILRNELAPEFQAERYDQGVQRAVHAIALAVQGEYHVRSDDDDGEGSWTSLIPFIIFLLILFAGRGGLWPLIFGSQVFTSSGRRRYRDGGGWYGGGGFGGFGSGGGLGGGGGFSGGGGSSGGGGASGGW